MKDRRTFLFFFVVIIGMTLLTGCSHSRGAQLANELSFPAGEISDFTISYDEENITFLRGTTDAVILKEYMTKNKESYYAKVTRHGASLKISEGGKPLLKEGFSRYIEVYLPLSYNGNLTVTTTNGNIDLSETALRLSSLRIGSTSGTVRLRDAAAETINLSTTSGTLELGSIRSEEIRLGTTSGTILCDGLNGHISCTSTSGDVSLSSVTGSGTFRNDNSGMLDVTFTEIDGDVSLFNKNDNIRLTLPEGLAFYFHGTTKNGSITTSFPEAITEKDQEANGTVGENPTVTVEVETKNGNIEVTRS